MKYNLGSLRRRLTSLLIAFSFTVLAITGIVAFVQPFSITVIGIHALVGFLFIVLIGVHIANNIRPLKKYTRSKAAFISLLFTISIVVIIWIQPRPVKSLLGLSANLGPAMERFEMSKDAMVFQYSPSADYKMSLTVKAGREFDLDNPPHIAIWLENQGGYHIKTLLDAEHGNAETLPYWAFKVRGWEKAKLDAEEAGDVDGVTSETPNGSFDPADYILPADPENPMTYSLLIEINQPGDAYEDIADQPSLVYKVEIDNLFPKTFQLLDLVGYPRREDTDDKEDWALYFVDEGFGSALKLIDSALLTIERGADH